MNKSIFILLFMFTCIIYAFTYTFKISYSKKDDYNIKKKTSMSCIAPSASLVSVTSVGNGGEWNNPATWSTNSVPTSSDDVTIGMGSTVTLSGTIAANSIIVMGTLRPSTYTTDFDITTKGIVVMGMGSLLEIGTATNLYTGKCTITLTGTDPNAILFPSMQDMGTKFIGAMSGGTLDMHGSNKKSWTNLNGDALAGATQITLDNIDGWMVGDEIVIVSSRSDWNEAEKRTITAINAATKTVSFETALLKPHYGTSFSYTSGSKTWNANLRAEVGLLTHNIKIQGDATSVTAGFGGHIMVMREDNSPTWGSAFIENIELFRMGQKKKNGRYPFHWHMLGNAGTNQYFKNSSEHISYNRALTIHGTSNTTVENNFFYDHIGHGIFLENGSEINNTIKGNVVLLTIRPADGEALTPSDNQLNQEQNRTPSSYWITNPNNIFIDNVAAGTQGTGFWYALAQDFMFQSLNNSLFTGQEKPYKEVLGGFTGNKSHSCMNGFDIFDQLNANHSIVTNSGWTENSLKYFTNNTFYANNSAIYAGIGNGRLSSSKIIFQDNIFVENNVALMIASYSIIDQSVFVASSGKNLITGTPILYKFYDGAGTVKNSHFVGWNATNSNFLVNTGGAIKHINHSFENISFDHSGTIRMASRDYSKRLTAYAGANSDNHPRFWSIIAKDKTGSISGNPNSSIVSNHPFILAGGETQPSNWTNMYSTNRSYALSLINYDLPIGQDPPRIPNVSVTRTKEGTPTTSVYYLYGYNEHHQLPVIVNEGFLYTYQYESLPMNLNNISTKYIQQRVLDANIGDSYVSRFKDFGKFGGLNVTQQLPTGTLTVYESRSLLESGTTSGYYIEPMGDLYIKSVATTNDQTYAIRWTTDFAVPPLDTDGDGYVDSLEGPLDRLPTDASDLRFTFTSTSDNWTTSGTIGSTCVACNSAWQINSNGNDANIIRDNLNFVGNKVPTIMADVNSNIAGFFKLYWTTESEPFYSEDKVVIAYYDDAQQRKNLTFNMVNTTKWTNNKIKSLKLKIEGESSSTNIFSINTGMYADTDGDGIIDSEEILACRNPSSASDFSINFDAAADATDTWLKSPGVTNFVVNNGIASGTSSNADPIIYKNLNYNFSGSSVPKITIRMRASAGSTAQIFWQNEDGGFLPARSATKDFTTTGWQELTFDLTNNTNWIGKTIKSLRIDPVNGANVNWEIDWIRAINYTVCSSCQSAYTAVALKNDSNWTYYGSAGTTDYLFAIEHNPSGGNTAPFTATINLTKLCDAINNVYNVSNTTTKEGVFIAGNYWNINTVGTLNGFVNMRFFPDATLNTSLDTKSNTFYNTATSSQQSSSVYFKTNNALNLPNDIRTDAKGLNYGFYPLTVNAIGTYASKDYVQFNQVTNINNSGGGLLKKVTKLNENTFSEKGILRYNPTADKFEGFNGIEWTPLH